jgi:hypothetical protein
VTIINLRQGIVRIRTVLLVFGVGLVVGVVPVIRAYGPPDRSNWPIMPGVFALYVVGIPLSIFLLWLPRASSSFCWSA